MLKNRGILLVISFVLFIIGFTALVMMLIGVNWAFLKWLDALGRTFGLLLRLLMIISGIVLFVAANTDWEKEKRDNQRREN